MIITADMIRRAPFSNLIKFVGKDIEKLIAADMARQAYLEGHRKILPHTRPQKEEDIILARRVIEADVFRYLVRFGPGSITAIRNSIHRDRHKIDNALAYMVADGRVKRMNRPTRGGNVPAIFAINDAYLPAEATQSVERQA